MKKYWQRLYITHATFWKKEHGLSLITSGICFLVALLIQRRADMYVENLKGTAVNDVLLNILPTWDIDTTIILSTLAFTFAMMCLFVIKPKYINFSLKTISLFIIIRAFFISLTHLGSSPHELQFDPSSHGYWLYDILYNSHGDFFFSGHTGLPFLMGLIFWREKIWRFFFLLVSLTFASFVLIAHVHYSIDVFAAPFITYSIFTIAKVFFKKDAMHAQIVDPVKTLV